MICMSLLFVLVILVQSSSACDPVLVTGYGLAFGMRIKAEVSGGLTHILVCSVDADSPAEDFTLSAGDEVVMVNYEATVGKTLPTVQGYFIGAQPDKILSLVYLHPPAGKQETEKCIYTHASGNLSVEPVVQAQYVSSFTKGIPCDISYPCWLNISYTTVSIQSVDNPSLYVKVSPGNTAPTLEIGSPYIAAFIHTQIRCIGFGFFIPGFDILIPGIYAYFSNGNYGLYARNTNDIGLVHTSLIDTLAFSKRFFKVEDPSSAITALRSACFQDRCWTDINGSTQGLKLTTCQSPIPDKQKFFIFT